MTNSPSKELSFKSVGDKLIVPDASSLEVKDALIVAPEDLDNTLVPRRRLISTCVEDEMQMSLCGSRGTGSIIAQGKSTVLNIFDLEEDDAEEDEDESQMEEEELN